MQLLYIYFFKLYISNSFNINTNLFEISSLVSIGGSPISDFVVEEGTDGIWTYRKWSSGIAECWGSYSETKSHAGTVLGGYAYNVTVAFPTNLFIALPIVTYSAYLGNQYALTGTLNNSFTVSSINLFAICNTSGSKATTWQIQAIGKWK